MSRGFRAKETGASAKEGSSSKPSAKAYENNSEYKAAVKKQDEALKAYEKARNGGATDRVSNKRYSEWLDAKRRAEDIKSEILTLERYSVKNGVFTGPEASKPTINDVQRLAGINEEDVDGIFGGAEGFNKLVSSLNEESEEVFGDEVGAQDREDGEKWIQPARVDRDFTGADGQKYKIAFTVDYAAFKDNENSLGMIEQGVPVKYRVVLYKDL